MPVFRFLPEFRFLLVQIYAFLFIFSPFLAVLVKLMCFFKFFPSVSGFLSGTDWHPCMRMCAGAGSVAKFPRFAPVSFRI